jgi:hypothetical protein
MSNPKELTRSEVVRAASRLRWQRKMPKWIAIVEGRELPARPLVLEAAGVPPNDSTNSHQAVEILKRLGFETRYNREEREMYSEEKEESPSAGGGLSSILEIASAATRAVSEKDWKRVPDDLSINVDHYLYGTKKIDK